MASSAVSQDNGHLEYSQDRVSSNSNAVEMDHLNTSTEATLDSLTATHADNSVATSLTPIMSQPATSTAEAAPVQDSTIESSSATEAPQDTLLSPAPATSTPAPPELSRLDSEAIGPSSDVAATTSATSTDAASPVCIITLLLTSGARHPYKLDEKYLTKRNVTVPGVTESGKKDPFSISVYTLKELILREWRDEWEAQPSSPSSIRLIHFGRLLDDKIPLKECRFNMDTPNVVHMTIKPQEVVDDEEASKGKGIRGEREGGERTPGCRCVIL